MEKEFLKHLYIEFRYGNYPNGDKQLFESSWKNKLWEEHGVMNNMDSYIDSILNAINTQIKNWSGTEEQSFVVSITRQDFPFETFFDEIELNVYITLVPNSNNCRYGGSYLSGKSGWVKNKYVVLIPKISASGGLQPILSRLRVTIAHELTHAYEDYCRRRLTRQKDGTFKQSGDDIWTATRKIGGFIATDMANGKYDFLKFSKDIGDFIYFTNKSEINAYVAQTKEELIPLMRTVNNSQDAFNAIKNTSVYADIEKSKEILNALIEIDTTDTNIYDEIKNSVILAFNKTREKDIVEKMRGFGKVTTANNFHQVVKILAKKFNKLESQYIKQVSKMAFDLYKKYGDPGTDNGLIRTK